MSGTIAVQIVSEVHQDGSVWAQLPDGQRILTNAGNIHFPAEAKEESGVPAPNTQTETEQEQSA